MPLTASPLAFPKQVFALMDLVGIDLIPLINASMQATLPKDDPYLQIGSVAMIDQMIAAGFTGRKGKGGFYTLEKSLDGKRTKLSKNLKTGDYAPLPRPIWRPFPQVGKAHAL